MTTRTNWARYVAVVFGFLLVLFAALLALIRGPHMSNIDVLVFSISLSAVVTVGYFFTRWCVARSLIAKEHRSKE